MIFQVHSESIQATPEQERSFTQVWGLRSEVEISEQRSGGQSSVSTKKGKLMAGFITLRHLFTPEFTAYYRHFEEKWTSDETFPLSVILLDNDGTTELSRFVFDKAKVKSVGLPELSHDSAAVGEIVVAHEGGRYQST